MKGRKLEAMSASRWLLAGVLACCLFDAASAQQAWIGYPPLSTRPEPYAEQPGNLLPYADLVPGTYMVQVGAIGEKGQQIPPAAWSTFGPFILGSNRKYQALIRKSAGQLHLVFLSDRDAQNNRLHMFQFVPDMARVFACNEVFGYQQYALRFVSLDMWWAGLENKPGIGGRWRPGREPSVTSPPGFLIKQEGWKLVLTAPDGSTSEGYVADENTIIATNWNRTGILYPDRKTIVWDDGTTWIAAPPESSEWQTIVKAVLKSVPRPYDGTNPLQVEVRHFSTPGPGRIRRTIEWEPFHVQDAQHTVTTTGYVEWGSGAEGYWSQGTDFFGRDIETNYWTSRPPSSTAPYSRWYITEANGKLENYRLRIIPPHVNSGGNVGYQYAATITVTIEWRPLRDEL